MSERPKRQSHSEGCDSKYYEQYDSVYMKHKGEKLCNCVANGWNACIDAWEKWEKENPRLERLDEAAVDDVVFNAYQDLYEPFRKNIVKAICSKFGQPKDAVSVDKEIIIDFINDVESGIKYLELNKQDYGYGKDRLRQKIATITRKLKGQYEDNTSPMR